MIKKKIRFSIVNMSHGGAEKVLLQILHSLPSDKYEITLFLLSYSGVFLNDVPRSVKIKSVYNPNYFPSFLVHYVHKIINRIMMYFPQIINIVFDRSKYDVDIAFLQDMSYLLKHRIAPKQIAWIHTNITKSPVFKHGIKTNLECADKIVCVSNAVKDILHDNFPDLSNKLEVIYNPIDIENVRRLADVDDSICYDSDIPTIIAAGKLTKIKGYDCLIKSFAKVIASGYQYNLKFLGVGEEESNLKNLVNELGLADKVEFLGFKKNLYPYIKKSQLFVLSSLHEGLSMVIIEAMILGIPVVSTNCPVGPAEVLLNGKCGMLVPVGDVNAMADAIIKVMNSDVIRAEYIVNSNSRVHDFNSTKIIKQVENLI